MKKIFSVILIMALFSTFLVVSADTNVSTDPSKYAVFLSGGFYGHNTMTVEGGIYAANGNVKFDGSGKSNDVKGNIVLNSSKEIIYENKYSMPSIKGEIIKLENTQFNQSISKFNDFPVIENRVDSFIADWWPLPETVTKSTHYKNLIVKSTLTIDVSDSDKIIIADALDLSGKIELIGNGKLYLLVNNNLSVLSSVNVGGNQDQIKIFVKGNLTLGGSANIKADVYLDKEEVVLNGSGQLTGNIITTASKVTVTDGSKLYGVIYAPNADFVLSSGGKVEGRLVAKSLDMYGDSSIKYKDVSFTLDIPFEVEKVQLNINVVPENAGTVTPSAGTYEKGSAKSIIVTPNNGYKFKGFSSTNGSALPNENGEIILNSDINLVAEFEAVTLPSDDIPEGNEVIIQYPYGYLYGYGDDSGNVGPNDTIKREEAVALLYRLLKNNGKLGSFVKPSTPSFTDINTNRWSFAAIEYMTSIGLYDEFVGNVILPTKAITRGEAAKIISSSLRIRPDSNKPDSVAEFTDLAVTNEYYSYIKALVDKGVMNGYGNGTISPDGIITRAEFVKMINMIIGRDSAYDISKLECPYNDLASYSKTNWIYENIMRASFGFSYNSESGSYVMDPAMKPTRDEIDLS